MLRSVSHAHVALCATLEQLAQMERLSSAQSTTSVSLEAFLTVLITNVQLVLTPLTPDLCQCLTVCLVQRGHIVF